MRSALALPLVLVLLDAGASEELVPAVPEGSVIERTCTLRSALELEEYTMALDGEVLDAGLLGEYDFQMEHEERRVVTDTFEAVADGRPVRLRRSFDELGGHASTRVSSEDGDEDTESDFMSALEGQVVLFVWDAEAQDYAAEFAPESAGDAELLAGLTLDMELGALLPRGPVTVGESWTIEPAALRAVLEPGGDQALATEDGGVVDSSPDEEAMLANLAGAVRGTFAGVENVEGARLARIELAAEVSMHSAKELAAEEIPEGGSGTVRNAVVFVLAGELSWDLVHGHARALDLGGDYELVTEHALRGDIDGEPFEQSQTQTLAGTIRFTARFERR